MNPHKSTLEVDRRIVMFLYCFSFVFGFVATSIDQATLIGWRSWIFGSDRAAVAEGLVGKLDLLFWSNRSCREGLYQLVQVWPWEGCLAQIATGGYRMRQFCFPNFPADLQEKKHQKQDKNGGAPSKKESFPAKSSEDDEFLNHVHQVGTVLFHLHLLGSKALSGIGKPLTSLTCWLWRKSRPIPCRVPACSRCVQRLAILFR